MIKWEDKPEWAKLMNSTNGKEENGKKEIMNINELSLHSLHKTQNL